MRSLFVYVCIASVNIFEFYHFHLIYHLLGGNMKHSLICYSYEQCPAWHIIQQMCHILFSKSFKSVYNMNSELFILIINYYYYIHKGMNLIFCDSFFVKLILISMLILQFNKVHNVKLLSDFKWYILVCMHQVRNFIYILLNSQNHPVVHKNVHYHIII